MPPRTGFNNRRAQVACAYLVAYINQFDSLPLAYAYMDTEGIDTPKKALLHMKELIEQYERDKNT